MTCYLKFQEKIGPSGIISSKKLSLCSHGMFMKMIEPVPIEKTQAEVTEQVATMKALMVS
jgi:hypothetical protein